jgi:hypothetical protein
MGRSATPPDAAFIYGPFAVSPALFVVPSALGQLAGIMAAGTGVWVQASSSASATMMPAGPRM